MKNYKVIFLILIAAIISSCLEKTSQKQVEKLQIWEDIQQAVKENKIDYLIAISLDTLECSDCKVFEDFILKEDFFLNHFERMIPPSNSIYSLHTEKAIDKKGYKKLHRINYSTEYKGNKYNVIYTLLENEKGVKFQGIFSIP